MKASVVTVRDPFHPLRHRELRTVGRRRRIRALAPKTSAPHIAILNGRPILRAEWRRRLADGDTLAFVVLPRGGGGGGKNPLTTVLSLALAMSGIPTQIAGAMLGTEAAAIGLSAIGMSAQTFVAFASSAIGFAATAVFNAFAGGRGPSAPSNQQAAAIAAPSPTYTVGAQGNSARLEQPIAVQYGRMMAYPDFAAQPYAEYAGNEQYLYQLLCLGVGSYDIESIRIDDTSISSFEEITSEIVAPGGTLTLFPANVVTSSEVSGQTMDYNTYIGGFIVNAAGTSANALAVDIVAPRGMFYANDAGGLDAVSVTFVVEARTVDSGGTPTSAWATLGSETITAATSTPQRRSYRYTSGIAGRYEVRVKRTSTAGGTSRYADEILWASLRAYLPETRNFGDVTLIALRMRATSNLSNTAARKINVISTRKLPIYTPGVGWSVTPAATRSLAWALADAARADYGGRLADARIDLDALAALDTTLAARGDTFDGRFDNSVTLWEALTRIGAAGRVKPFLQGGIIRVVRDAAVSLPVALFSPRNIVKGSLTIDYLMPTDETADAINVGYFDSTTWQPRRVQAKLPGSTAARPVKVDLFGVTGREQAYREGLYLAACNRYRRKIIKFSTEMDGFIPAYGDLIAISHDVPAWGTAGEIVGWDAGTQTATLSEPVTFGVGTHYIGLRARDGSVDGPHVVTAGVDTYHVVLATSPAFTPYTGGAEERTHFAFGAGETWRQPARVVAIRPRGLYSVEIEAVNEDASVHTADSGAVAPAAQSSALPSLFTAPVVAGLSVRSARGDAGTMLISWQAAPGGRYYIVEASSDGDNWSRVGETTGNNLTAAAIYANATLVRVAAVGMTRGPWITAAYSNYSDYMWSATSSTLMWSGTSSTLMWSA